MLNLNITYKHIDKVGTCNFCCRGELKKNLQGMKFPYNHVFVIRGNSLSINMCRACVKELKGEL